jgi:hypothetical protein
MTWKESKDKTRKWLKEKLERSTAEYADHVENKLSRLQAAYLSYLPSSQRYSYLTEVSQRLQDVSSYAFDSMSALYRGQWGAESATPAQSQEGITGITHGF